MTFHTKHLWVKTIEFDKVNGIIEIYNGTRYLELFDQIIYNAINDRINCLMSEKK